MFERMDEIWADECDRKELETQEAEALKAWQDAQGPDYCEQCGCDACECDMVEFPEDHEFDDDGQPDEYTEWQDLYGGDDWDHGQYDE